MIKLKAILAIIFNRDVGVVIFEREPQVGDSITIGNMIAYFTKIK